MPLLLLAVFILVPIAELYVIIQIGGTIGIVPTLLLLIVDSIVGTLLLRHQGRSAWVRFNRALAESRMPAREVMDGVLIVFGGALLLTPGFLTDIVGVIFLIPPTRAIVRGFLRRFAIARFALGPRAAMWGYGRMSDAASRRGSANGGAPPPRQGASRRAPPRRPPPGAEDFGWTSPAAPPRRRPDDIEGTAEEIRDDESLPPGERGTFPG